MAKRKSERLPEAPTTIREYPAYARAMHQYRESVMRMNRKFHEPTPTQCRELERAEQRGYLLATETVDTEFFRVRQDSLGVRRYGTKLPWQVFDYQAVCFAYEDRREAHDLIERFHPCGDLEGLGDPTHLHMWEDFRQHQMLRPSVTAGIFHDRHLINAIEGKGAIGLRVDTSKGSNMDHWIFWEDQWRPLLRFLAPLAMIYTFQSCICFDGRTLHVDIDLKEAEGIAAAVVDLIEENIEFPTKDEDDEVDLSRDFS